MNIRAYGTYAADKPLEPMTIERRTPGPLDVEIDILFCGICHSDLHQSRGEWAGTRWPCVPGHEIVGRVASVGSAVTRHRAGDLVGVGCLTDSCMHCEECTDDQENYCDHVTYTYNSPIQDPPGHTLGGYSQKIIIKEHFVLKVSHPEKDLAAVAPLLCAGITLYQPLRHWNAGPGKKVGIVGIGGLGHVGLKIARALGAEVVALTTSESKREDAIRLGANEVIVTKDRTQMEKHAKTFDLIVNTVAVPHDLDSYIGLLRRDGTMVMVGAPAERHPAMDVGNLIGKRRSLAGSGNGGIRETQEMLDFCAQHGIVSDIELIAIDEVNAAYERVAKNDVKYRFVIRNETLSA